MKRSKMTMMMMRRREGRLRKDGRYDDDKEGTPRALLDGNCHTYLEPPSPLPPPILQSPSGIRSSALQPYLQLCQTGFKGGYSDHSIS